MDILSSLLFQVPRISLVTDIFLVFSRVLFFIGVGFLIFYLLRFRKIPSISSQESHLPDTIDTFFAEKSLFYIKQKLLYLYPEKHTFSHTGNDISLYYSDEKLLSLISLLEKSLYSSEKLSEDMKISIRDQLQNSI